jgi:ribosomal protein S12 methylthiotransferase accessory factor
MAPGQVASLDSLPNLSHPNLKEEIQRCLTALSRLNLEVWVIETTHPQLGLPAVYVLIPGTHFLDRTRNNNVIIHLAKVTAIYAEPYEALEALSRMALTFPDRFDLHFFLGHTLQQLDQPEMALPHFEIAASLPHPAHEAPNLYVNLGACLKDLGEYDRAMEVLQRAAALDPHLKDAHHFLGFCYFKQARYQDAVNCFERAIELDHGSAIDYANLGINLAHLGHLAEAAYVLKQALELDPSLDFAAQALKAISD